MRRDDIDMIKGVGAILVILGHSFTYDMREEYILAELLWSTIYSFHMPLFFFMSGYLYIEPDRSEVQSFIKKKFIRLMVPYYFSIISIELLKAFLCGNVIDYKLIFKELFVLFGNGWFLSTMFILLVVYTFIMLIVPNDIKNNRYNYTVMSAILIVFLLIVTNHISWGYFRVDRVILYLPYFVMGNLLKNKLKKEKKGFFLCSIVFVGGNIAGFGLHTTPDRIFINYLIALSGIYVIYYLFSEKDNKLLFFWGRNSMIALTVPGLFISGISFVLCNYITKLWYTSVCLVFIMQIILIYFVTKYVLSKNRGLALLYGCRYEG